MAALLKALALAALVALVSGKETTSAADGGAAQSTGKAASPASDPALLRALSIEFWLDQVFPDGCYETLIVRRELDVECGKKAAAKVLGFGITAGAAIVKLPQIANMLLLGSAGGVSFQATFTELIGNFWIAAYNIQMGNPLSSFGEAPLIALQNTLILLLILVLGTGSSKTRPSAKKPSEGGPSAVGLLAYLVVFAIAILLPWAVSLQGFVEARSASGKEWWAILLDDVPGAARHVIDTVGTAPSAEARTLLMGLYLASTGVFAMARVPQIIENQSNAHMGAQSFLTIFLQVAGTTARIFTSWTETKDIVVTGCFAVAASLNWILLLQFFAFWTDTMAWRKRQSEHEKTD